MERNPVWDCQEGKSLTFQQDKKKLCTEGAKSPTYNLRLEFTTENGKETETVLKAKSQKNLSIK